MVSVEASKPGPASTSAKARAVEESGSGVLVRLDNRPGFFVLTNNHVIAHAKLEQIAINLSDGRLFRPGTGLGRSRIRRRRAAAE